MIRTDIRSSSPPTRSEIHSAAAEATERVTARVRELAARHEPPRFEHVADPDAAIFLCAIDHSSGYDGRYLIGGAGPFEGSALLWAVGLRAAAREPGLLQADRLRGIGADRVAALFRIGGETVSDPGVRAELWRDLADGLAREYEGSATALLEASGSRLAGAGGLIPRLGAFEAYDDPLAKKAYLFAKICERRGWLEVADPEHWEVCADNVLMRLALRSGLVEPGGVADVRAATRAAFKRVAEESGLAPPLLDDLLWELGRDDPDLLGREAGDLREPARDSGSSWY